MMRLYALSGRQGSAIAQYERLRDVLSDRLGTEPGVAARDLRDEIAAGNLSPARTDPSPESPAASTAVLPARGLASSEGRDLRGQTRLAMT